MLEDLIGKKEVFTKTFPARGDFGAHSDATKFCYDNGICVGSMCGPEPIGVVFGDCYIAKWRNIGPEDKSRLDGVLISGGGFREGSVTLLLSKPLP